MPEPLLLVLAGLLIYCFGFINGYRWYQRNG